MKDYTLGFIGGGNMAASLIGGLVPQTLLPARVLVSEPNAGRRSELQGQFGVRVTANNAEIVEAVDVVIVAVKPQVIRDVLPPLAELFASRRPLLISIVAGIRVNSINRMLERDHAVVRVMPNTPTLVGRGASGMYASPAVSEAQKNITEILLSATGITEWVESEADIDTITALSGSGPAYFMLFMQALSESAVAAGLDPQTARRLTVETAAGTAELVRQSPEQIEELIRRVTSPGGTTEQALKSLTENDFARIVGEALDAARQRSRQLAAELEASDTDGS